MSPLAPLALETGRTATGTAYVLARSPSAVGQVPTLLLLAMAGAATLTTSPYCEVGQYLQHRGWQVVSLDLPCHGADQRAGEPADLDGWAARVAHGEDFVAAFQLRVNDLLAHLVAQGLADPARLAAAGTSRGGYLALHAAAGNPRIRAVAAFAPVTDLRALREFAASPAPALLARLDLQQAVPALAGRAVWITIGNADARVDTDRVIGFARALVAAAPPSPGATAPVTLHVLPLPGHVSIPAWHVTAATWLHRNLAPHPRKTEPHP